MATRLPLGPIPPWVGHATTGRPTKSTTPGEMIMPVAVHMSRRRLRLWAAWKLLAHGAVPGITLEREGRPVRWWRLRAVWRLLTNRRPTS